MGLSNVWLMLVYTEMCHTQCVFLPICFVILGLLLLCLAGFCRHLHVVYSHWYLMSFSLHNCMRHNTPFCMFNKDNNEHLTQVKRGHAEYLGSLFDKDDVTFKFSEDSRLKFRPCEMLAKQVLNPL